MLRTPGIDVNAANTWEEYTPLYVAAQVHDISITNIYNISV